MKKTLSMILLAMSFAATGAFAAYGDHALLSPAAGAHGKQTVAKKDSGDAATAGGTAARSMADFFRWNDRGARNSSAN